MYFLLWTRWVGKKQVATSAAAPPTRQSGNCSDSDDDADTFSQVGSRGRSKSTSSDNNLRQQVEELNAEVGRQRQVIDILTTRLNFVLSMFGADEVSLSVDKDTKSATGSAAVKARDTDVSSSQKSFRGAVLSAVYSDMREQETRSKNFVVSGPCYTGL